MKSVPTNGYEGLTDEESTELTELIVSRMLDINKVRELEEVAREFEVLVNRLPREDALELLLGILKRVT